MPDQKPLEPCKPAGNIHKVENPTYTAILFRQAVEGSPIQITDEAFFKTKPLPYTEAIHATSVILNRLKAETETAKSEPIPGNRILISAYDRHDKKLEYYFILVKQKAKNG